MSGGMSDLIGSYRLCPVCGWEYHKSNLRCPKCYPHISTPCKPDDAQESKQDDAEDES